MPNKKKNNLCAERASYAKESRINSNRQHTLWLHSCNQLFPPLGRSLCVASLVSKVNIRDTEPEVQSITPFKIVHQRPSENTLQRHAVIFLGFGNLLHVTL